jgi:hypothetical protein
LSDIQNGELDFSLIRCNRCLPATGEGDDTKYTEHQDRTPAQGDSTKTPRIQELQYFSDFGETRRTRLHKGFY